MKHARTAYRAFRLALPTAVLALLFLLAPARAQSAPQLDLNGPAVPGIDFAATFVEDDGPTAVAGADLTISDAGSAMLHGATLTLAPPVAATERLSVDTSGTNISAGYSPATGILRLRNGATLDAYAQVLRSATYDNSSDSPATSDRLITFVVDNGAEESAPAHTTVTIQAVNDAPLLDNSGDLRFADINEDDLAQKGNAVATLLASGGGWPISDVDQDAQEGIAVIEAGAGNGAWQYSLDAGVNWLDFNSPASTSAVLLNLTARVRFLPQPNFNGQAALTFRAWDQSSGANGETGVDASINGGSSAFSSATEVALITVLAVDDPPQVDANGRLPGIDTAAAFLTAEQPVLLTPADALVSDLDSSAIISLTVTLLNRPDGAAESLAPSIVPLGLITAPYDPVTGRLQISGSASPADYSAALRGLRYQNTAVPPDPAPREMTVVAGDGASSSAAARITLQPVLENTPPRLDETAVMAFTPVAEDDAGPPGDSVAALLAGAGADPISDPDEGARRGFAVVAAQNQDGVWQYSVDGGAGWLDFGALAPETAVLLDETARIRFLPAPDFSGASRSITVRAWDQTSGANGYSAVNVAAAGSVSSAAVSIAVDVLPRNDAPQITMPDGISATFAEDGEPVVIAGPALSLSDSDSALLASATVRILDKPANEPDILALPGGGPIFARYDAAAGVLSLNGSASLAGYQAALRSVTFANTAQDPRTADRLVQFRVFDGANSSNTVTAVVQVTAGNDAPTLDLNGESAPGADATVYFDQQNGGGGTAVSLAPQLEVEDVDDTSLVSALLQLAPLPDGASERLAVQTAGTNIAAVYDPQDGRLTLTGLDSLANYRTVLRSAVYSNSRPFANRAVREVRVTLNDGHDPSVERLATIIPRPQFAFFPMLSQVANTAPQDDEPNDVCVQAYPIEPDLRYSFAADDRSDWYSFTLQSPADVTVELTNFLPLQGQLVIGSGACGALQRIGHNGDFALNRSVDLGRLDPGTYTVLVINDGPTNTGQPYHLLVRAE